MKHTLTTALLLCAKSFLWTAFFLCVLIILTGVGLSITAGSLLHRFTTAAGITSEQLLSSLQQGWATTPRSTNDRIAFLLLGTDTLDTRPQSPTLTDTIMLVTISRDGSIRAVSLPRDLWSDAYKTRINALFEYGAQRFPEDPTRFPREALSEMTGVPINYTLTVSIQTVTDIIDLVGGIDVHIPVGFTDPLYPRDDIDVTSTTDPRELYETVTFTAGHEVMTGKRALQYIRSRHAADGAGTDLARSERQRHILSSLLAKTRDRQLLTNPEKLGALFAYYNAHFAQALPFTDVIGMLRLLLPVRSSISFTSFALPVFPEDPQGVIFHPNPVLTRGEWIYRIRDPKAFQKKVRDVLNFPDLTPQIPQE